MTYSKVCFLVGMLCAAPAFADGFADRVTLAQQAIKSPEGARYDQLLMPYIQTAINSCVRQNVGGINGVVGGEQKFTLVGAVRAEGILSDAQVRPQTAFSNCFVQEFGRSPLPNLHLNGIGSKAPHPIVVNVRVRLAP